MGNVNYYRFVNKDTRLRKYLKKCKYRIFCFTNGVKCRAKKVLNSLGIEDLIEGVICVDDYDKDPIMKPEPEAFTFVNKLLRVCSTDKINYFDDLEDNVIEGLKVGWNANIVRTSEDLITMLKNSLE